MDAIGTERAQGRGMSSGSSSTRFGDRGPTSRLAAPLRSSCVQRRQAPQAQQQAYPAQSRRVRRAIAFTVRCPGTVEAQL